MSGGAALTAGARSDLVAELGAQGRGGVRRWRGQLTSFFLTAPSMPRSPESLRERLSAARPSAFAGKKTKLPFHRGALIPVVTGPCASLCPQGVRSDAGTFARIAACPQCTRRRPRLRGSCTALHPSWLFWRDGSRGRWSVAFAPHAAAAARRTRTKLHQARS